MALGNRLQMRTKNYSFSCCLAEKSIFGTFFATIFLFWYGLFAEICICVDTFFETDSTYLRMHVRNLYVFNVFKVAYLPKRELFA